MNKDEPAEPIIAEDYDAPPGFYFDVCPACKCMIEYRENPCRHCGQIIMWREPENDKA